MRDMANRKATRRDLRREATKATVLDAAHRVFLNQGFDGATIKEIAAEAGVSPGTVLNAEPTKAALLVSILRGESERLAETLEPLESALTGSAVDRLRTLLQMMLDGHLKHTELFAAALGHRWLDTSSDFQTAFDELKFIWEPVRRVLSSGVESGEFDVSGDIESAMLAIEEVFYGCVREAARDDGADPRAALTARMGIVISGLKA